MLQPQPHMDLLMGGRAAAALGAAAAGGEMGCGTRLLPTARQPPWSWSGTRLVLIHRWRLRDAHSTDGGTHGTFKVKQEQVKNWSPWWSWFSSALLVLGYGPGAAHFSRCSPPPRLQTLLHPQHAPCSVVRLTLQAAVCRRSLQSPDPLPLLPVTAVQGGMLPPFPPQQQQ